jgi:hypothetical protein
MEVEAPKRPKNEKSFLIYVFIAHEKRLNRSLSSFSFFSCDRRFSALFYPL